MRNITTTVYNFHELSDEAKEKAIQNMYDINIDTEWWLFTYDDAENIGLKITEFDLSGRCYVKGNFTESAYDVAQNIIREHGAHCETVKSAMEYLKELETITAQNLIDNVGEEYPEDFLDTEDIDGEFLRSLLEDYRIIMQKDYDYLTSEEAIMSAIDANIYEFTVDGKLV